jgi:hypothetical protein
LLLSFTNARQDPRVLRQVYYLRDDFAVTIAGLGDPGLDGTEFMPICRRKKTFFNQGIIAANLLAGNYAPAMRRFALLQPAEAMNRRFDLVLVNDAEPLPLGFAMANGAPVVFDAHEYYPKEFEKSWRWLLLFQPYMTRLCAEYIPRCAGMTTVAPGIAEEYRRNFGVLPEVVRNTPEYQELPVNAAPRERIRLVHHGAANPDRHLELMVNAMDYVDKRFTLDLYLVGRGAYMKKLEKMAAARRNVTLRPPVPMAELVPLCNQYDMGLYLLPPTGFNVAHMLPNKFFEFIQARIGIAIGPSAEMAPIVKRHDLGVIGEDFTPKSLAAKLNALTAEDIMRFKGNADTAAKIYNAQASMEVMKTVLRRANLRNSRVRRH